MKSKDKFLTCVCGAKAKNNSSERNRFMARHFNKNPKDNVCSAIMSKRRETEREK